MPSPYGVHATPRGKGHKVIEEARAQPLRARARSDTRQRTHDTRARATGHTVLCLLHPTAHPKDKRGRGERLILVRFGLRIESSIYWHFKAQGFGAKASRKLHHLHDCDPPPHLHSSNQPANRPTNQHSYLRCATLYQTEQKSLPKSGRK